MRKLMILAFLLLVSSAATAPASTGAAWCLSRSNSYCTFAWDKLRGCCYATYTAPGAGCPTICQ